MVSYRDSPEGSLIYTVFAKKVSNTAKRGYPLFLTHFREGCAYPGIPTWPLGGGGRFGHFGTFFRGRGYPVGATFEKYLAHA